MIKIDVKSLLSNLVKRKIKIEKPIEKTEKKNDKKEKIILLVLVFCGSAIFSYFQFVQPSAKEDTSTGVTSSEILKAANKSVSGGKQSKETVSLALANTENPFVSDTNYQNVNDMSIQKQIKLNNEQLKQQGLPAIPNYSGANMYSSNNNSLPIIPNIPSTSTNMNLANMPIPSSGIENKVQIQGIMSDEYGTNMAIVDGHVVKAGDTLNGTVISSINSNGITFSNGNQISYNIAK